MGKLIVIDGLDGSGKATQVSRLYNRLKEMGKEVYTVSFPNYNDKSSEAVKMYLSGELGMDAKVLNPYMCSIFYTVDRAIQFQKDINGILNKPQSIVICDRYISANIIHQGSKLDTVDKKREYFEWIYDTEVKKVGLPLEDITIILSVPIEVSQKLMDVRYSNGALKRDIHESDIKYLKDCYETVDIAIEHLNKLGYNWVRIDCSDGDGGILGVEEIGDKVYAKVLELI